MVFDNLNHIAYIYSCHYYLRSFWKVSCLQIKIERRSYAQRYKSRLAFKFTWWHKDILKLLRPVVTVAFFGLGTDFERFIEYRRCCVYVQRGVGLEAAGFDVLVWNVAIYEPINVWRQLGQLIHQ